MIVSENVEAAASAFAPVLDRSVSLLKNDAAVDARKYIESPGTKLEGLVLDALNAAAAGTEFDGTIRLASGQKFPDIVLQAGGLGVEVKSTTQDHWTTTGNSVLESTRIPQIEKVFLLFGKLADPVDFRARPYEACLKEVLVTHYPRYQIDMNLPEGQTIFDKIGKSYDEIRNMPEPVAPMIEYYSSKLKPGESLWWAGAGGVRDQSAPMTIRELVALEVCERERLIVKSLVLFPQVFGSRPDKFHEVLTWLLRQGIICGNIRDFYTAGGKWRFQSGDSRTLLLPKIVRRLYDHLDEFRRMLLQSDAAELQEAWGMRMAPDADRFSLWCDLLADETRDNDVVMAIKCMLGS